MNTRKLTCYASGEKLNNLIRKAIKEQSRFSLFFAQRRNLINYYIRRKTTV